MSSPIDSDQHGPHPLHWRAGILLRSGLLCLPLPEKQFADGNWHPVIAFVHRLLSLPIESVFYLLQYHPQACCARLSFTAFSISSSPLPDNALRSSYDSRRRFGGRAVIRSCIVVAPFDTHSIHPVCGRRIVAAWLSVPAPGGHEGVRCRGKYADYCS